MYIKLADTRRELYYCYCCHEYFGRRDAGSKQREKQQEAASYTLKQKVIISKSKRRQLYAAAACLFLLAACSGLPSAGPRSDSFNSARWQYVADPVSDAGETADNKLSFVLVDVDPKIISVLSTAEDSTYFKGSFTERSEPSRVTLGVGDIIRITIFESGPGGLFIPANATVNGGNYVTLPDQEVDQAGYITIPYAEKDKDGGLVKIDGRQLGEVQSDIQQRLMNKAIEPQVIVTLVKRMSSRYSIIGDIGAPGRYNLDPGGTRVLDALSNAGGPRSNDYNTLITLQRGDKSATVRMSALLTNIDNNVFVQANDLITVKKEERYYNMLGATRTNSRVAFEAEKVTVADAVAKAGGLDSSSAEPAAVVIFRREDQRTLDDMGVKLDGIKSLEAVPTIYRFNLNEPSGLFLAQRMQLRNDDVVYVSNHPFTDITKLFSAFRDLLLLKLITD